jgi:hypothetical protein
VLAAVFLPQVAALATQAYRGFVPFGRTAPERVALSWDMFATSIVRCDVRFDPSAPLVHGTFSSLRAASSPIEWDIAAGSIDGYRAIADAVCKKAGPPLRASLVCFLPDGSVSRDAIECR